MGKALADQYQTARHVFEEVDEALGRTLSDIIWNGPDDQLVLTENTQPALMAVSLAAFRVLEQDKGVKLADVARLVAGHSLGEYSALAAAGCFTVSDAARLLEVRGKSMQQAVPVGEGAMAALLGMEYDDAVAVAQEASAVGVCTAANDNAPGQIVLSGAKVAVERAMELAKEKGARRAVLLPVSAPFHCALMQPAAERMAAALADVSMQPPAVPLVANVTAAPVSDVDEIRRCLLAQVTGNVRWRESVLYMAGAGIDTLYEIGAGRVLTGLARRIDRKLDTVNVGTPEEIEAAAEKLAGQTLAGE